MLSSSCVVFFEWSAYIHSVNSDGDKHSESSQEKESLIPTFFLLLMSLLILRESISRVHMRMAWEANGCYMPAPTLLKDQLLIVRIPTM